jgi:hypothetical protein
MPEQARRYGDITVAVTKLVDARSQLYDDNPQIECVELIADVPAGNEAFSAVEKLAPVLETLVDLMSFEMATPLGLGQMNVIDITPPVSIGDERDWAAFASAPTDRHARAIDMQAVQGMVLGRLPESVEIGDSKTAAVLRWFVKALSTDFLHDQFIFLWIAFEILCDASDVRVREPYVGPCGHEVIVCPVCEEPTTRMVRGATMRAFLHRFGVSQDQAKELWRMRQLMHGAIPFDSEKLAGLGTFLQSLRAVVAAGLKARLVDVPRDVVNAVR